MSDVPDHQRTTGVVLIGGMSRRFGTDKSTVRMDGAPLAERLARTMSEVVDETVASGRAGQAGSQNLSVTLIPDDAEGRGPLSGIKSVFSRTQTDWLLVGACDMPGITPEAIRQLLDLRTRDTDAIVARDRNDRLHPLFACYRRTTAGICTELVHRDELSVTGFVRAIAAAGLVLYPTFCDNILVNVNRPEDLETIGGNPRFSTDQVDTT